jgi:hypothetical protein
VGSQLSDVGAISRASICNFGFERHLPRVKSGQSIARLRATGARFSDAAAAPLSLGNRGD